MANKGVSGSIMAAIGRRDNIRHKVEQLKNFFRGGGLRVDRFLFEKKRSSHFLLVPFRHFSSAGVN